MKLSRLEYEREVQQPHQPPTRKTFTGKRLRLSRYARDWDLKRGSAARLMSILIGADSETLQARVCESDRATRDYEGAVEWFAKEAQTLRQTAAMHDTVSSRLQVVLERCRASRLSPDALIRSALQEVPQHKFPDDLAATRPDGYPASPSRASPTFVAPAIPFRHSP
jgi:hypothetical protein